MLLLGVVFSLGSVQEKLLHGMAMVYLTIEQHKPLAPKHCMAVTLQLVSKDLGPDSLCAYTIRNFLKLRSFCLTMIFICFYFLALILLLLSPLLLIDIVLMSTYSIMYVHS